MLFTIMCSTVFITLVTECAAINFPRTLPRCFIDDPEINKCLLQAAATVKPLIRNGIRRLGVPAYDPRIIPYFSVVQRSDVSDFEGDVQNMIIKGMENYDLTEISYDPESMMFSGKLQFTQLSIKTLYHVNGSIISIPLVGQGAANLTFGPLTTTFKIAGKMEKHRDVEYYKPIDVGIKLEIEDVNMYLDGLFDENPELGTTTNELINRNSKLFTSAVTPVYEGITQAFIARYIKWLTSKFPFYKLFPRSKDVSQ